MAERNADNKSNLFKADGMFAALENWRLNFDFSDALTLSLTTRLSGGRVGQPIYHPHGLPFDKLPAGVDPHSAGWRIEISSARRFGIFEVSRDGVIEQRGSGPPPPRTYGLVPDVSGEVIAFLAAGNLIKYEGEDGLFARPPRNFNLIHGDPVPVPSSDQVVLAELTARIRSGIPE